MNGWIWLGVQLCLGVIGACVGYRLGCWHENRIQDRKSRP